MDQGTLVEMQIDDGQRFIDRLVAEGVPVTAGFWLKESESGEWFLYLVTPLVGEDGATRSAYRRVVALFPQLQKNGFWVDPLKIKLIGPTDPVAQEVLGIHKRATSPPGRPIRWEGTRLGNVNIEGAYLYPLPAGASG